MGALAEAQRALSNICSPELAVMGAPEEVIGLGGLMQRLCLNEDIVVQ